MSSVSPGRRASWPETKTRSPARIACEYGAPWNGAGAASVRTTDFSATLCSFVRACLCQSDTQGLEDRVEDVLGVGAVEEAHVQRQPGAVGEPFEETARDIGSEPADPRLRKIDVRDEQRRLGDFEDDVRECLGGRHQPESVAAGAVAPERRGERPSERAAGLRDLRLGCARLDLEREVEERVGGETLQESVENREAGLDVRRPGAANVDANAAAPGCRLARAHLARRLLD